MRWTKLALAVVGFIAVTFAIGAAAIGLTAHGANVAENRPFTYWAIAAAFLMVASVYWPTLLSWYIAVDLPPWLLGYLRRSGGMAGLEAERGSRTILDLAASLDAGQRAALPRRILGNGMFYVVAAVPWPIVLGFLAVHSGGLRTEETIPLLVAMTVPAAWTVWLVARARKATG